MFCASTRTPEPSTASTATASAVNGTHSPTSTPLPTGSRPSSLSTYWRVSATVLCIFQLPATKGARSSGIVERLQSREWLSLEQLEGCAATRGQVRNAVGQAELRERGGRVAAADDRGCRRGGHRLGHGSRTRGKGLE